MLLLIVDDEHHAADSLESMLAPLAMREGFQMIKAYSGKEALNLTQDKEVNAAVLDINMPGMNGLILAQELVDRNPNVQLVFLTGHSEFDYAYRAAKFPNQMFLLKIEEEKVIIDSVKKAVGNARRDGDHERIMAYLLNRHLLENAISRGDLSLAFQGGCRNLFLFVGEISAEGNEAGLDQLELAAGFCCRLKKELSFAESVCADADDAFILAVSADAALSVEEARKYTETAIQRVQKEYSVHAKLTMWPRILKGEDSARALYAMLTLQNEEGQEGGKISLAPQTVFHSQRRTPEKQLEDMQNALTLEKEEEFFIILNEIRAYFATESDMRCLAAMETLERMRLMLIRKLGRLLSEEEKEWQAKILLLSPTRSFTSWNRAFANVSEFAESLFRDIRNDHRSGADETLARILDYVKTHISEPFTLCEMGEALNYHPAYLSRFFRNATGEKLFEFIANQRLMRAKMLLRTTGLRVSEIAAKCGYENAQYFATQFKSAEGVTPTQWRSQS